LFVASITGSITSFVGNHGIYAVFVLLIVAAVFPAASELVMLYAGAVAAGAFAGAHVALFGTTLHSHPAAYVSMAIAGTLGNLVGAAGGWAIGRYGGRPFLERHGRKLHVNKAKLDRAERWFERRGGLAVVLGFAAPILRSFVAIPAGITGVPFVRFIVQAAVGCATFCFAFAGIGWAVGASYGSVRRYVDYIVAGAILAAIGLLLARRLASSRLAAGRAEDSPH
jgi:membrane protein DedA with SNARE-associated domain